MYFKLQGIPLFSFWWKWKWQENVNLWTALQVGIRQISLHLGTDKTEEAESYHYGYKNIATEVLIFADSLFTGSWGDGW